MFILFIDLPASSQLFKFHDPVMFSFLIRGPKGGHQLLVLQIQLREKNPLCERHHW